MTLTSAPDRSFAGKVALVTGAASGIGRATALAFARAGARVIAADVDEAGGEETVRLVGAAGGEAVFVRTDVAHEEAVAGLVEAAVARFGRLDCAHNNAGREGTIGRLADCSREEWDGLLAVNLTGVWLCLKYEIAQMLRQGGGAIVNTSSTAGLKGSRTSPAYVASKHGVVGLTRKAALEYAADGIRVNAVCPAVVRTPLVERVFAVRPDLEATWRGAHPIGRFGTPEEVAAAVVWLCSDAAAFVTGHAMVVDGGMLA
jgi:NAD(P)-dependent dehydrogenase (short-subunit alcohol dehydrogenase family)